jgi:hypothetical protein
MKNIAALTIAGIAVVTIVPALTGCAPTTEKAYTGPPVPPPTVWTGSPAPAHSAGHGGHGQAGVSATGAPTEGATLHQYIVDNKIAEVPFKKDQPGTPKVEFPLPPGWNPAGDLTPDWAYGAIYYGDKVKPLEDSTFMYAIASKLTGDVDPQKILDLAPGQLNELPGFSPVEGPPTRDKFAGYDAVNYAGTYEWDGKKRSVGQETIVIPGKDGLYVLQLNGEAPGGQEKAVIDAAGVIRAQTKITLPS